MRLFDSILRNALRSPDGETENIVLGWKGSFLSIKDGRWGLGALPRAGEPLLPREDHTRNILSCSVHGLARLLVSPYPQEFSAASAALSALSPAGNEGKPLEYLLPLPSGENVSLLAPDPWVVDFLRDWSWHITIFDDFLRGVNVFPEWTSFQHLRSSNWIWLNAETLRNRLILSLIPLLRQKKGVILQGPGIPFLPSVFQEAGVTHLVLPVPRIDVKEETIRYIAAGGTPWNCPSLLWKVFPLLYTERMPS